MSLITLAEAIDASVFARPDYLLPEARPSYHQWWRYSATPTRIWLAYAHLGVKRERYKHVRTAYVRRWDISTSGESRFVQNGHPKKTRNENRDDWRSRKGFARDQSKGRCWCKCRLNDARAGRRAWERDAIKKGDWETVAGYTKNDFVTNWDCC